MGIAGEESPLTQLFRSVDGNAADAIVPVVYEELRRLAGAQLSRASLGSSLPPTALVHEAYVRLVGRDNQSWENRRHFFFAAARAMRDIVVERARTAIRRGERTLRRPLDADTLASTVESEPDDVLALNESLHRLAAVDERAHQVVVLRFFSGLSLAQIADVLDVTQRTVDRDWRFARSWLFDALRSRQERHG